MAMRTQIANHIIRSVTGNIPSLLLDYSSGNMKIQDNQKALFFFYLALEVMV